MLSVALLLVHAGPLTPTALSEALLFLFSAYGSTLSGTNESAAYTGVPAPTSSRAQHGTAQAHTLSLSLSGCCCCFSVILSLYFSRFKFDLHKMQR